LIEEGQNGKQEGIKMGPLNVGVNDWRRANLSHENLKCFGVLGYETQVRDF
jgi:hypothetical protein